MIDFLTFVGLPKYTPYFSHPLQGNMATKVMNIPLIVETNYISRLNENILPIIYELITWLSQIINLLRSQHAYSLELA